MWNYRRNPLRIITGFGHIYSTEHVHDWGLYPTVYSLYVVVPLSSLTIHIWEDMIKAIRMKLHISLQSNFGSKMFLLRHFSSVYPHSDADKRKFEFGVDMIYLAGKTYKSNSKDTTFKDSNCMKKFLFFPLSINRNQIMTPYPDLYVEQNVYDLHTLFDFGFQEFITHTGGDHTGGESHICTLRNVPAIDLKLDDNTLKSLYTALNEVQNIRCDISFWNLMCKLLQYLLQCDRIGVFKFENKPEAVSDNEYHDWIVIECAKHIYKLRDASVAVIHQNWNKYNNDFDDNDIAISDQIQLKHLLQTLLILSDFTNMNRFHLWRDGRHFQWYLTNTIKWATTFDNFL